MEIAVGAWGNVGPAQFSIASLISVSHLWSGLFSA